MLTNKLAYFICVCVLAYACTGGCLFAIRYWWDVFKQTHTWPHTFGWCTPSMVSPHLSNPLASPVTLQLNSTNFKLFRSMLCPFLSVTFPLCLPFCKTMCTHTHNTYHTHVHVTWSNIKFEVLILSMAVSNPLSRDRWSPHSFTMPQCKTLKTGKKNTMSVFMWSRCVELWIFMVEASTYETCKSSGKEL